MGQDGTRSYLSIIMASMVKIIFYYLWMNIHLHFAYMLIYSLIAKVPIWAFVHILQSVYLLEFFVLLDNYF